MKGFYERFRLIIVYTDNNNNDNNDNNNIYIYILQESFKEILKPFKDGLRLRRIEVPGCSPQLAHTHTHTMFAASRIIRTLMRVKIQWNTI